MITDEWALAVIDMQKYYLSRDSSYYAYFESLEKDSMKYIISRCSDKIIKNIRRLIDLFHEKNAYVVFLRLCSEQEDRSDMHPAFARIHKEAEKNGFNNLYPLCHDPMAEVIEKIKPLPSDTVIIKKTYSAFTESSFESFCKNNNIKNIVFTGIATSQCVETTARDAADRGYRIIHIEDAQCDYDELNHRASLFASQGVCGGEIYTTSHFIRLNK